jgi:DNA-binding transcriptional MerR regulator
MKAKEIESLESYFKTENEHWNGYAFEMLCEVLKQGNFENPETPLQLFDKAEKIFTEQHETPLKAVQEFAAETEKAMLIKAQSLFVYEWVYKYVRLTSYEGIDLAEIKELLKSQTERLKNEKPQVEYNKPLTGNIRDTLKEMIQKEFEQLPETLKGLEPVERLNILCKLIPYVLPKVESVTHRLGEPEHETEKKGLKWQVP